MAKSWPIDSYFSLDIEGAEYEVLKTVPWDNVDIEVLLIELIHAGSHFKGSREEIHRFLSSKNYVYLGSICINSYCQQTSIYYFYFSCGWCFCKKGFIKNKIQICRLHLRGKVFKLVAASSPGPLQGWPQTRIICFSTNKFNKIFKEMFIKMIKKNNKICS